MTTTLEVVASAPQARKLPYSLFLNQNPAVTPVRIDIPTYMTKTIPTPRSDPHLKSLLAYTGLAKKLRLAEDSIMQLRGALSQIEKTLLVADTQSLVVQNKNLAPGLRINIPSSVNSITSYSESYAQNLQIYADILTQLRNFEQSIMEIRVEMIQAESALITEEMTASGMRASTASKEAALIRSRLEERGKV